MNVLLKQSIATGIAVLPAYLDSTDSCASSHHVCGLMISQYSLDIRISEHSYNNLQPLLLKLMPITQHCNSLAT